MPLSEQEKIRERIRQKAIESGFDACGFAHAMPLDTADKKLDDWISRGFHAEKTWIERNREKRHDPTLLVENARTIIVLLLNYYPTHEQSADVPKIARYAYGQDYHSVMKSRLFALMQWIHESIVPVSGRAFVDSAPVFERTWAQRAGLGWLGKNSLLINKKLGSFFCIGELILDIDLPADEMHTQSHCGSCTRCIDACPVGAIVEGMIDCRACLSNQTQNADTRALPLYDRVFACDICQEVCPWNKDLSPTSLQEFKADPELLSLTRDDWEHLTKEQFSTLFQKKSLLKQLGYEKYMQNIQRNSKHRDRHF